MKLAGRVAIVTGAAHGIGSALARKFAAEGARGIVVSDVDITSAQAVAASIGDRAVAQRADATKAEDLKALVDLAVSRFGGLDVFASNAGLAFGAGIHAAEGMWQKSWELNVMQHVHAAQVALPAMLPKREGYLLITASGAGLLGLPGDAPYSITKHAAVGAAEWLALTYKPRGIRVSALCPLGVKTGLLMPGIASGHPAATAIANAAPLLEADAVAQCAVDGMDREEFLILPHESVRKSYADKASDPDAWLDKVISGEIM